MKLFNQMRSFVRDEEAQDLIEYALLIGLISLVAIVGLTATGTSINGLFNAISTKLTSLA